jgi:hypothetical protein
VKRRHRGDAHGHQHRGQGQVRDIGVPDRLDGERQQHDLSEQPEVQDDRPRVDRANDASIRWLMSQ